MFIWGLGAGGQSMRDSIRGLFGLTMLTALAAPGTTGAVTLSVDRGVFESGLRGPLVRESFDADIATADSIRFASGIVASKSSPGVPPTLNRVRLGDYDGFVVRDGVRDITWDLPQPVFGFGGDFSGAGTNFGSLFVTATYAGGPSERFSISDAVGAGGGFFGLSGSRAIASLLFSTDAGGFATPGAAPIGGQLFTADDVAVAPVPPPAAFPLMLTGVLIAGGFGLSRRGRATRG